MKRKTITEFRSTIFETFDEVVAGESQVISHKNGTEIALVPIDKIKQLEEEIELHKNLSIGYAQALRGDGISSKDLKSRLEKISGELKKKYG